MTLKIDLSPEALTKWVYANEDAFNDAAKDLAKPVPGLEGTKYQAITARNFKLWKEKESKNSYAFVINPKRPNELFQMDDSIKKLALKGLLAPIKAAFATPSHMLQTLFAATIGNILRLTSKSTPEEPVPPPDARLFLDLVRVPFYNTAVAVSAFAIPFIACFNKSLAYDLRRFVGNLEKQRDIYQDQNEIQIAPCFRSRKPIDLIFKYIIHKLEEHADPQKTLKRLHTLKRYLEPNDSDYDQKRMLEKAIRLESKKIVAHMRGRVTSPNFYTHYLFGAKKDSPYISPILGQNANPSKKMRQ